MAIGHFSLENYNLLKSLLEVTKEIKLDYDELCKLEINNQKDTIKYQSYIEDLKEKIQKEEEIYNKISKSIDILYLFAEYLFPNGLREFEDEIEVLKLDKIDEIIKIRLSSQINSLIINYSFTEDEDYDELDEIEEVDPDEMIEFEEDIDFDKEFKEDAMMDVTIMKDISNTILTILNKYINNENYSFMRDKLIKFKYNYSYIYKSIEYSILENNFEINPILYWENLLVADLQKRDLKNTKMVLNKYIQDLTIRQLENFKYLINNNINEQIKKEHLVLFAIIFRTILLFVNKRTINNLQRTIDLEIILSGLNDPFTTQVINEIFNENINDKSLPNIISLKPRL